MQNIMTDLQEELHNAKTQLTELQVAQNDVMQSKAATSLKKNELITENQKLKETVEQLEREAKEKDEVNAMQTQVGTLFCLSYSQWSSFACKNHFCRYFCNISLL